MSSPFRLLLVCPSQIDPRSEARGLRRRQHNFRGRDQGPGQELLSCAVGQYVGRGWNVRNFGVNGATLLKKGDKPYWKQRAFEQAHAFEPDVVVIKLGTNDSKPQNWKHKADYVTDYLDLIEGFRKLESKPEVFICYPVPAYRALGITDKVIKEEVMPRLDEVAKKSGCKVIDLYSALSDKKSMFPDRVHPNAAGASVIAEVVDAASLSVGKKK